MAEQQRQHQPVLIDKTTRVVADTLLSALTNELQIDEDEEDALIEFVAIQTATPIFRLLKQWIRLRNPPPRPSADEIPSSWNEFVNQVWQVIDLSKNQVLTCEQFRASIDAMLEGLNRLTLGCEARQDWEEEAFRTNFVASVFRLLKEWLSSCENHHELNPRLQVRVIWDWLEEADVKRFWELPSFTPDIDDVELATNNCVEKARSKAMNFTNDDPDSAWASLREIWEEVRPLGPHLADLDDVENEDQVLGLSEGGSVWSTSSYTSSKTSTWSTSKGSASVLTAPGLQPSVLSKASTVASVVGALTPRPGLLQDPPQDRVPLWRACYGGDIAAVRGLLRQEDLNVSHYLGGTPLALAAACGHEALARFLTSEADCGFKVHYGQKSTALCQAVIFGHTAIVDLLLQQEADPNEKTLNGKFTPLMLATSNSQLGVVRQLCSQGNCDVDASDKAGRTAFSWAAYKGDAEIIRYLVEQAHCNKEVRDKASRTGLVWAAVRGHTDVVRYLVQEAPRGTIEPCDIEARDQLGRTALIWAAVGGFLEATTILVQQGADLNVMDKLGDATALDAAAFYGHLDVARFLVSQANCDREALDKVGRTALLTAAWRGHPLVVQCLLEANCDSSVRDRSGLTALHWASRKGYAEIVQLLLNQASDVNETARDDRATPLILATVYGHLETARFLLEQAGCQKELRDRSGRTALHWAATRGPPEVVELLVAQGADINARELDTGATPLILAAIRSPSCERTVRCLAGQETCDKEARERAGRTALHMAVLHGSFEVVRALVSQGADTQATDSQGNTATTLASRDGREDVVHLLTEQTYKHDLQAGPPPGLVPSPAWAQ